MKTVRNKFPECRLEACKETPPPPPVLPVVQAPVVVFTLDDLLAFYEDEVITIDD